MLFASLALAPFALRDRKNGLKWPVTGRRLAFLGGLSLSVDLALWTTAVHITTAANATLFANTAPLWVALASWLFFGQRLVGAFWVGLLVTLGGAAAILGSDFLLHPSLGWGDMMSLAASVFYAGYYLCAEQGRRSLPSLPFVWLAGCASTVALLVFCLVARFPLLGYSAETNLAFLGQALVTQVAGYVAVAYALGHLPASVVSPSMVGQPLVTALLAIPLLGESLTLPQWIGGAAVVLGILLVHRSRAQAGATNPQPNL
jgi:drug/metabolite transporter (DMT)-like permease